MAGDKLWVAGVELAEPASPRRRPRTRGRRPPVADPSHPGDPHLNQARAPSRPQRQLVGEFGPSLIFLVGARSQFELEQPASS